MTGIKFPLDMLKLGPQIAADKQFRDEVREAIIQRLMDGKVASLRAQSNGENATRALLTLLDAMQELGIERDVFKAHVFRIPTPVARYPLYAASIKIGDSEKFLPLMMERVNRG